MKTTAAQFRRLLPALQHVAHFPHCNLEVVCRRRAVKSADVTAAIADLTGRGADSWDPETLAACAADLGVKVPAFKAQPLPPPPPPVAAKPKSQRPKVQKGAGDLPIVLRPPVGDASSISAWLTDQGLEHTVEPSHVVTLTPSRALAWLRYNQRNRKPSAAKIRRFATAMAAGRWMLNGETVKFSAGGRLLDGQSRLMACARAGVAVTLEVRGGLPDLAQESMDTGESRQHRHQLEMLGQKNPNELAAALRLVFIWARSGVLTGDGAVKAAISNTTIRETLEAHPDVCASVGRCLSLKALMPVSCGAFFHYLARRVDAAKADTFFERLTTGANLGATSPVYQLRERLMADRLASAKIGKRERHALIVHAWNAYATGKALKRLTFNPREPYPVMHGLASPTAAKPLAAAAR